MRRTRPLLVVLGLVVAGCGPSLTRSDGPTPTPLARTAARTASPPTATPVAVTPNPGPGDGSFTLVVRNPDGEPAPGIAIRIDGPSPGDVTTDADGRARVTGPPGTYTYRVPLACAETVDILRETSGRFGIAAGQQGRGEIVVAWRQRFGPAAPVFWDVGPYWPTGRTVTLRFDVVDRCEEGVRAPKASIATYRYEPASNLRVVGRPVLRADGGGFARVAIRCAASGRTSLMIVDRHNTSDAFDLVAASGAAGPDPECRSG